MRKRSLLLGDSIFKWNIDLQVESHSEGCEGRVDFIFDFYFTIFLFRRIFCKMGINFRGVAS